jgi:hypothetical protein
VHPIFGASWTAAPNAFPAQYYPNSPDLSSAQSLDLKGGQEAEVDLTVHAVPAATISGVIAGALQNGVFITYSGGDEQETSATAIRFDTQTGKFAIRMVPFGSWTFHFRVNDAQGNSYYAEQDINVNRPVIAGLQILLQSIPPIAVIVNHSAAITSASAIDSSTPVNEGPGVQVQLLPSNANGESYSTSPQPGEPQGAIFLRGVRPGKYKVVAQAFGPECIESVSTGGVDLIRNDLLISPTSQPQPISVSLRNDCATLTGVVHSESKTVGALALLVPNSSNAEPQVAPVESDQRFTFSNLTPGDYHVWAFSSIVGLEYANPDKLREYRSERIDLAPGQKSSINVDLVLRGN